MINVDKVKKTLSPTKVILLSCSLSFALTLCPGFVRSFSLLQDFWISYVAYFLIVAYLCNKYTQYKIAILLSFLSVIITIYGILTIMYGLPYAAPNNLSTLIACICGYLFSNSKKRIYKFILVGCSAAICIIYICWGFDYYVNYYFYGSFSGKTNKAITPTWIYYVNNCTTTFKQDVQRKLVLLDFFSTSCAVCFNKFPIVQNIYNKYKDDSNIVMYAVDIPLKRDTVGMALQMVRSRGYTFPILIGKEKLDSIFQVDGFPVVILIENNTIIYRGNIENVSPVIDKIIGR